MLTRELGVLIAHRKSLTSQFTLLGLLLYSATCGLTLSGGAYHQWPSTPCLNDGTAVAAIQMPQGVGLGGYHHSAIKTQPLGGADGKEGEDKSPSPLQRQSRLRPATKVPPVRRTNPRTLRTPPITTANGLKFIIFRHTLPI